MIVSVAGDDVTVFRGECAYVVAASAIDTGQGFGLITCTATFASFPELLLLL